MAKLRHPPFRRFRWHPAVAGLCLGYLVYRVATAGWSTMRVCGLLVCGTWFVMACVDLLNNHCLLDWMYDEE